MNSKSKDVYLKDSYLNLTGFGRLPLIRQSTSSECGIACLAMIANYYGFRTDLSELRRKFPVSIRGANFKAISEAAREIGLSSRAIRLETPDLKKLRLPAILHFDFDHFVILKKLSNSKFTIYDPASGVYSIPISEMDKRFTGVALELIPAESFAKKSKPTKLSIGKLIRFDRSFVSAFSLGFILSLLVEVFMLATPFYMQIIVDEVLMKGDKSLLNTLAIGFCLLVVFQTASSVVRNLTFQYLGHFLSFDMAARIFHHLLKLPISYFETRELGDIQHRVESSEQVKQFLISSAPKIILDTIFGLTVLSILFAYNLTLAFLVLSAVIFYLIWRLLLYKVMRRAAGDLIIAEAQSQTQLLETIRSYTTLKLNAFEAKRESTWRNTNARKLNAGIRVGNLNIFDRAFNDAIFNGLKILVIFMAANMVMNGEMTVGMITAFIAYYGMFTQRASNLINLLMDMRLLEVPLTRIADIVFEATEKNGTHGGRPQEFLGKIELKRVYFAYGTAESRVLSGASLCISPGEFVAIIGPSGVGKSTLLKIITCLEKPDFGDVLFDGRPVNTWSLNMLRNNISSVLQDDTLFKGSIAENVSLFDDFIDMDLVRKVCAEANIADEIEAMPMGYESIVGDMGNSFSGGQKQRLLLARALYKRPKILLLDEATSHLDDENEATILKNIKSMGLTRLVIAHRRETICAADRVMQLRDGKLFEVKG